MLSLLLLSFVAAPPESPVEAPKNWQGETIELPPSFAPKLGLKGWEHIRFSPEMFAPQSDRFFSYAVLFDVEKIELNQEKLSDEILIYYRGLASAVSEGKIDGKPFSVEWLEAKKALLGEDIVAAHAKEDKAAKKRGVDVYRCTLDWVEPFRTQKKQKLQLEIHIWDVAEQTRIFFCVSSAKWDHKVWKDLRKIRTDYEKKSAADR